MVMKLAGWVAALALTIMLTVQVGLAQQASPGSGGQQGVQLQANSLIGSTVRGQDGKDLGKVQDLMIDPKDGKVTSVLVSMGGTLGVGSKQMSVPWDAVQVARDQQKMVVTIQQPLMPQAPSQQQGGQQQGGQQQKQ
jgi:sporulation protein YlmC with PRC-barrel domain